MTIFHSSHTSPTYQQSQSQSQVNQMELDLQSSLPQVEFTIIRSGIRFYATKCRGIPSPIVAKYFSQYRLIYWSAGYTLTQIESGIIVKDDIAFRVSYQGITRGEILAAVQQGNHMQQLALSFRSPKAEWNLPPVVIISPATTA